MIANGRVNDFKALIQRDLGGGGDKIFRSDSGTLFSLCDWKKAFQLYSKGNARKLLFKLI